MLNICRKSIRLFMLANLCTHSLIIKLVISNRVETTYFNSVIWNVWIMLSSSIQAFSMLLCCFKRHFKLFEHITLCWWIEQGWFSCVVFIVWQVNMYVLLLMLLELVDFFLLHWWVYLINIILNNSGDWKYLWQETYYGFFVDLACKLNVTGVLMLNIVRWSCFKTFHIVKRQDILLLWPKRQEYLGKST